MMTKYIREGTLADVYDIVVCSILERLLRIKHNLSNEAEKKDIVLFIHVE